MATARSSSSAALGIVMALTAAIGGCAAHDATPALPVPPVLPAPPPPGAPAAKRTADIVAASLTSVVLLIHERPGKAGAPPTTTFGAGFLTRGGLVVTSLHVVDGEGRLSAMLHRPGRKGYAPMDGGLSRFLFENDADLVGAERVAVDGVNDLAVVRLDADTSHLPALVWSADEVRAGDRVLALGHPQETVWSFSEGVVGALQHGVVQHDAIVGPGSSGGPLLNERGEVVGVNIARVMNQQAGLSFARPIAIVASSFGDRRVNSPLDQSAPGAAALSCWRAQQLALPETADCFDWESEWSQFQASAEEARRLAPSATEGEKIERCFLGPQVKPAWMARERDHAVHVFDPQQRKPVDVDADHAPGGAPESSFAADYKDPQRLARRLRNGMRLEDTHVVSPDMAWVLLASRAADGTVDRFTELYVRIQGRWVQRLLPAAEPIAALPASWPKPLVSHAAKRPKQVAAILKEAASAEPCPLGQKPASSASAPGGGGRAVLRPGFALED
jgi:S1-C subfamily serine protease